MSLKGLQKAAFWLAIFSLLYCAVEGAVSVALAVRDGGSISLLIFGLDSLIGEDGFVHHSSIKVFNCPYYPLPKAARLRTPGTIDHAFLTSRRHLCPPCRSGLRRPCPLEAERSEGGPAKGAGRGPRHW